MLQANRGAWRCDGRHHGLVLQCSVNWVDVSAPPAVLAHPFEASGILCGEILADPHGVLAALRRAWAPAFAERPWIAARCAAATREVERWLGIADRHQGAELQWVSAPIAWAVAGLAAVPALAAVRDTGVRRCLATAREILHAAGQAALHERLQAALGVRALSPSRVEELHRQSLAQLDCAVRVHRTRILGDEVLHPHLRPHLSAGVEELLGEGLHREAMWRVHRTHQPASAVQLADAPPEERPMHRAPWDRLRSDLGLAEQAAVRARTAACGRWRRISSVRRARSRRRGRAEALGRALSRGGP